MRCNSFVFPAPGKTKQQKKMQLHLGEQENGHTFTTINKAKLMKTLKKKRPIGAEVVSKHHHEDL